MRFGEGLGVDSDHSGALSRRQKPFDERHLKEARRRDRDVEPRRELCLEQREEAAIGRDRFGAEVDQLPRPGDEILEEPLGPAPHDAIGEAPPITL